MGNHQPNFSIDIYPKKKKKIPLVNKSLLVLLVIYVPIKNIESLIFLKYWIDTGLNIARWIVKSADNRNHLLWI